jgi:hypothetical protein
MGRIDPDPQASERPSSGEGMGGVNRDRRGSILFFGAALRRAIVARSHRRLAVDLCQWLSLSRWVFGCTRPDTLLFAISLLWLLIVIGATLLAIFA